MTTVNTALHLEHFKVEYKCYMIDTLLKKIGR